MQHVQKKTLMTWKDDLLRYLELCDSKTSILTVLCTKLNCEALEIQVLETRLNKLVDRANMMRNQWVEVHHRDKKIKS